MFFLSNMVPLERNRFNIDAGQTEFVYNESWRITAFIIWIELAGQTPHYNPSR